MRNVESVKARLKNIAKETGRTMQDVLISYGLERTIMRLAKSSHVEKFTLKGGIFLYALMDGQFARATTDIDSTRLVQLFAKRCTSGELPGNMV